MRRFASACGAATLSAVVLAFSFAPYDFRWLAWLALVPFLVVTRGVGVGAALGLGWYFAILYSVCLAYPLVSAISAYYFRPLWVAWAFAVGLLWTTMAGPYYMAFALANRALARRGGSLRPLGVAAAWTAAEFARARLFTGTPFFIGNPWGIVGYTQADWGEFVQIASVTGVYGMSFAIAAVNAAVAELWIAWRARGPMGPAIRGLGLAVVPALLVVAYGHGVLRSVPANDPAPALDVAIVQGNVDVGSRWRPDLYGQNLDTYFRLTHEAFAAGDPKIVIWPEAAMTFFLADEPAYRDAIGRLLASRGAELVAGGPSRADGEPVAYFNSMFLVTPRGEIRGRYDKEYLVPFSEYFPLGQVDALRRRFGRVQEFQHGTRVRPLETKLGLAGILVCNEAMFPEAAARRVRAGAAYLVNPSNDDWITDSGFGAKMFEIVSLRAVEQRRYLVRASTSGPSAVLDPWGRVEVQTRASSRTWILGRPRARSELSTYGRVGDLFAFATVAATAVALLRRPSSSPDAGGSGGGSSGRA